jgi:DNA polymerase IV
MAAGDGMCVTEVSRRSGVDGLLGLDEHLFVSSAATILHADLDAFFASVEQRDDPRLRGRPVIVGGGVVLAASYEAKARGVRTAMSGSRARRLCPNAVVVPPRMSAYAEASKAVFRVFEDTTPLVEGLSIDEAFLDTRGMERLAGSPAEIAAKLRRDVRERVGLPITVGVARTKFLAKVASAVAKPDGLLVVPPDRELAFLHPLPVERLWGVGPVTAGRLHRLGITTVAQVAGFPESALTTVVGRAAGRHLHALAHNRDPRPVERRRRRRSVGSQRALGRRPRSAEEIDAVLVGLVDRVTRRMRAARRVGRTVVLRLRFDDFSRATRSHTVARPTAETQSILGAARGLVASASPEIRHRGLTLVGIAVTNLDDERTLQLELPFWEPGWSALDAALDEVRKRYGADAVKRGVLLGRDAGITMPLLPD